MINRHYIKPVALSTREIAQMPVTTKTGPDFGRLVMVTTYMKDGRICDILFDAAGELITAHDKLKPLSTFFNKAFRPASIDGAACLINIVK